MTSMGDIRVDAYDMERPVGGSWDWNVGGRESRRGDGARNGRGDRRGDRAKDGREDRRGDGAVDEWIRRRDELLFLGDVDRTQNSG